MNCSAGRLEYFEILSQLVYALTNYAYIRLEIFSRSHHLHKKGHLEKKYLFNDHSFLFYHENSISTSSWVPKCYNRFCCVAHIARWPLVKSWPLAKLALFGSRLSWLVSWLASCLTGIAWRNWNGKCRKEEDLTIYKVRTRHEHLAVFYLPTIQPCFVENWSDWFYAPFIQTGILVPQ